MAHAGNLTVVGDPDQSIYSWRNANSNGFSNLLVEFPQASVVRLTKNYRSTDGILQLAAASLLKESSSTSTSSGARGTSTSSTSTSTSTSGTSSGGGGARSAINTK